MPRVEMFKVISRRRGVQHCREAWRRHMATAREQRGKDPEYHALALSWAAMVREDLRATKAWLRSNDPALAETPWQKWQHEHPGVSVDGWINSVAALSAQQDDHEYQRNVGLSPKYDGRHGVWL